MILSPLTTQPQATGHYCPVCMRRVRPALDDRRQHRESCASGELEISLVLCPVCGLTLAAEPMAETTVAPLHALHS